MKGNEVLLVWVLIAVIALLFIMSFTVLRHTPTFGGGFTFFLLVPIAVIIYVAIYTAKHWKELLK